MGAKLARWVVFTILFSLIPLAVDFVSEIARSSGVVEMSSFGRHGELYLLASAICAVGLGEVLGVNDKYNIYKILAGGGAVVIITAATALYTISASDAVNALTHASATGTLPNESFSRKILSYSGLTFLFACIVSTSCIALSEVKNA